VPVLDYVTPSAIATDVRGRFRRWTQRYDPITQFLACWFMPGIVFLSLIKHKHAHYPIPILPPLIITTAAGMVHFIRWRRRNPPPMTLVLIWTAVCLFAGAVGAHFVLHLSKIPTDDLRHDLAILVGVITAACIGSSLLENRRWNIAQTACIILCTVIVEISLQCTVVPALDEYRPQAELAQRAAAEVPADKTIYLLGRREEEHEAQYAYYLREPMQRCDEFTLFPSFVATNPPPLYAIVPNILIPDLQARWKVTVLDQTSTVRPGETEDDHLKLVRLEIAASN
jgi:4-amino-4-deoxy-L-arabinose transferase-like glycosyltransferase